MIRRTTRRPLTLLLGLALALLSAFTLPDIAGAVENIQVSTGDTRIRFGQDAHVGPDESLESVVVFGGDAVIEGTVGKSVVTIGGDVLLHPGALVGGGAARADATVVTIAGDILGARGAEVVGRTIDLSDPDWDWAGPHILTSIARVPFAAGSPGGWVADLAVWIVLGLFAAAVAPRQLGAVGHRLEERPLANLGWGALEALVIFPLATLLMVITIVGMLLAVPSALIVVPFLFMVGYLAAAGIAGRRLLAAVSGHGFPDLIPATIIGLIVFKLLAGVPILGTLLLLPVWIAGLGATVSALREWYGNRRGKGMRKGAAEAVIAPN